MTAFEYGTALFSALVSEKRWVQRAAGLCFSAMMLAYAIAFCSSLS
jgi:hypothetical protein